MADATCVVAGARHGVQLRGGIVVEEVDLEVECRPKIPRR